MIYLFYIISGEIIAAIIAFIYWQYLTYPYRLITVLTVLGLVCEVIGYAIRIYRHAHNVWLFNLYMPFEPLLLGAAGISFIKARGFKKIATGLLALNFIIWLYEICRYSIYDFASFAMICGCFLLVIIYIGVLFGEVVFNNKVLVKEPLFWLSLSTILYFACDIPFMGLLHYWPTFKVTRIRLSNINQVLNFFRYPLVAVSFLLAALQKKEQIKSNLSYVSK